MFFKHTGRKPSYVNDNGTYKSARLKAYDWADFTVNKKLFKMLTLSAGIKNIFDITQVGSTVESTGGVHVTSGARNLAYGRSYFAGLAFNWDKR